MRLSTILKVAGGVVVVVIGGVVVFLATLDVNKYKGTVIDQVAAATGRKLTIDGDIKVSLGLNPALVVDGVHFADAPWTGSPEMASVQHFEAVIALMPLLHGQVAIKRLVLVNPTILLEHKGSEANWQFTPAKTPETPLASDGTPAPDANTPAPPPSKGQVLTAVQELQIKDGTLVYKDLDHGSTQTLNLHSLTVQADTAASPLQIAIDGDYQGVPFSTSGTTGSLQSLMNPSKGVTVDLKGTVGVLVEWAVSGSLGDAAALTGLDAKVSLKAPSLKPLQVFTGALPPLPAIDLATEVKGAANNLSLSNLNLTVGTSKLAGSVSVDLGQKRPLITADLSAAQIDLGDLLGKTATTEGGGAGGGSAGGSAGGAKIGGTKEGRVFSSQPLPLAGLKAIDSHFAVKIARLVLQNGMVFEGLAATGDLTGGKLVAKPVQAVLGGGEVTGDLVLDASGGPAAKLALNVDAKGMTLGRLFQQLGKPDLATGVPTDAGIHVVGSGASQAAIMATLDGSVLVKFGAGTINNKMVDWLGADILNQIADKLNPFGGKEAPTSLVCGVINTHARAGVATWDKQIAFETSKMTLTSSGSVDLGHEQMDVGIDPEAKGGLGISAGALAGLMRLQGSLAKPHIGVDAAGVAKEAGSIAGAVATGGLSLLAQNLVNRATGDTTPCATALAASATAPTAAAPTASTKATKPASKPKSVLGKAGSAIKNLFGN